jgi:hypothetical protein
LIFYFTSAYFYARSIPETDLARVKDVKKSQVVMITIAVPLDVRRRLEQRAAFTLASMNACAVAIRTQMKAEPRAEAVD